MKCMSGPSAVLLVVPIIALITRAGSAIIAGPTELSARTGQGPFPTLPPLRVTITPAALLVEPPAATGFRTLETLSPAQTLDLLAGPRALVGSGIALAILAAAGFQFFRKWQFPSLAGLRSCNVPKLIAGVVIAILGVFIGLLGLVLLVAGAAEGPLGAHTAAVGGLMLVVGALFVYLGAKIVLDTGCFTTRGS